MDKIILREMSVSCIIGTLPREREIKQTVVINIELSCDLSRAGDSDNLEDTLNYKDLKEELFEHLSSSTYYLIERMADRVADICLSKPEVQMVKVTVDKPGALTGTRSVAVEIERGRR